MPEIAKTDKVVHDDAMGVDRQVLAGQPVPPDLLDAYHAAGGETTESDAAAPSRVRVDPMGPATIASRDLVVTDALGVDRQVLAGQPVPPDLLEAYSAETGEKVATAPAAAGADYDAMSVADLQAEADRLGLEVTGTGKDGNVVKADLVNALKAHAA